MIAAALPIAIFIPLSVPAYSEKTLEYLEFFIAPQLHVIKVFSPVGAYFVMFITALAARIAAMPKALIRIRARWLTSFVET